MMNLLTMLCLKEILADNPLKRKLKDLIMDKDKNC